jgi:multiple antibiotic resistance protein
MSFFLSFDDNQVTLVSTFAYVVNTFISIFVMVDPFAAVPIYLLLTDRMTPLDAKKTRRKAVFIAFSLLILFAIAGIGVLNFFGISVSALRIAGGLLLLLFAIDLMGSHSGKIKDAEESENLQRSEVSVVPLAMPLLAGPGSISTTVVQSTRATSWVYLLLLIFSIALVMWASYITLKWSLHLYRFLGRTGLNLLGRIMGILIAAIAVEFIMTGIREAFFQ